MCDGYEKGDQYVFNREDEESVEIEVAHPKLIPKEAGSLQKL